MSFLTTSLEFIRRQHGASPLQLVLINISDHFVRVRANGLSQDSGRVYGCLLGQQIGREVSVSNSFEMIVKDKMGEPEIDDAFLVKKQDQCEPHEQHQSFLLSARLVKVTGI